MSGPCLGAWMLFMGGLHATGAWADEPAQGGQGTRTHGIKDFDTYHVAAVLSVADPLTHCTHISLEGGGFRGQKPEPATGPCEPQDFVGHEFFVGGEPDLRYRIAAVRPHRSIYETCRQDDPPPQPATMGTTWEYEVLSVSAGGQSEPLCPGKNVALAVPLAWVQAAPESPWELHYSQDSFSFACVPQQVSGCDFEGGGVIAKCVDWGYAPWPNPAPTMTDSVLTQGTTLAGEPLTDSLEQALSFHQTCLRMATADYCGVGISNTLDGTPIGFHDTKYVPLTPEQRVVPRHPKEGARDLFFEAAWVDCSRVPPGVEPPPACVTTTPRVAPPFAALCLSKLRWASLPVAGSCFDRDSSTDPFRWDFTPRYCEDYTEAELEALGARFFTFSRYLDTGLYRFTRNGAPEQALSTTAYVHERRTATSHPNAVLLDYSFLGLDDAERYTVARLEGALISRSISEALRTRFHLAGLYRCARTDTSKQKHFRHVALPGDVDPQFPDLICAEFPGGWRLDREQSALEGYVSPTPQGIAHVPLYSWDDGLGHFMTATRAPGAKWQTDLTRPLGYIPGNP
ncbi:hypothetical protein LZ198_24930 [Myxococcus sp. K15C18031901]|uniref:ADYC domain-containing protein n=1 Tax=Myxococcus dinghuensis TaxID=2906761 RepID=UPI0020A6F504|nr:ADYC domain-containing protein [Myxococcus dinghuensis]MCP3102118.1 hypothetical protein [Myxococcus dinghuensis]